MKQTCKSVLVVDDDRAILRTFSRILQKAGFSTETADSGKEALEKIQTQTYDIALIDLILGDSNGLDLLPKIEESSPKTVKIMITGAASEEKRSEARKKGADALPYQAYKPRNLVGSLHKEVKLTAQENEF